MKALELGHHGCHFGNDLGHGQLDDPGASLLGDACVALGRFVGIIELEGDRGVGHDNDRAPDGAVQRIKV